MTARTSALLTLLLLGAPACKRAPAAASDAPATRSARAPQLPDARGFGARTPGGRDGRVIRVTTLASAGPGSLAAALTADGPRVVVFEVAGVIDLGRSVIRIEQPFLTLAGQTAPSPGITIIKGGLQIATHDVVIQHIRVRPGEAGAAKGSGWEVDGISTTNGAHHVIVDHCSTTWGTDENLSASGERFRGKTPDDWRNLTSHDVTFSNNIVAEGLSNSTHKKGEHSKGGLIHDNVTRVAIIGNLYASNVERNPFFKGGARGVVVNNYVANPQLYAMKYTLVAREWGDRPHQLGQMAIVGNVFTYGPDTMSDVALLHSTGPGRCEVFLRDNLATKRDGQPAPSLGGSTGNFVTVERAPLWPEGLVAMAASEVAAHIRQNVGARPWERDAIDSRIVTEALAGGGKIIDSESEVGGYPSVPETRAPFNAADWDLTTLTRRENAKP